MQSAPGATFRAACETVEAREGQVGQVLRESPSRRDFVENGETGAKLLERQQLPKEEQDSGDGGGAGEELMRRKGQKTRKDEEMRARCSLNSLGERSH